MSEVFEFPYQNFATQCGIAWELLVVLLLEIKILWAVQAVRSSTGISGIHQLGALGGITERELLGRRLPYLGFQMLTTEIVDQKVNMNHHIHRGMVVPLVTFRDVHGKSPQQCLKVLLHRQLLQSNTAVHMADQAVLRTISMDTSSEQAKRSGGFSTVSDLSAMRPSLSLPSTSSVASPLSSQSYLQPASSTILSWPCHSSGHQLVGQVSDSQTPARKSSDSFAVPENRSQNPSWGNESTQGFHGGSSDGRSTYEFSELLATSHSKQLSFDSDSCGFNHGKTRSSSCNTSHCVDLQTCGICTNLLTERSMWSSQKLVSSNELSVVSVLTCGHVYHAECLEAMTPEIHKYDPSCPVCTLGEKQTHKISQKALKAELSLKVKRKRSKNRTVDGDLDGDSFMFDCIKGVGLEDEGPKMTWSFSTKSTLAKPFLKRHFSFGSKDGRPSTDNHWIKKKGFFWTRSLKI